MSHDNLRLNFCAPELTILAHLNTNYRHFFLFVDEFSLLSERDLMPMEELNKTILADTLPK